MNFIPQLSLCVLATTMLVACSDGQDTSPHESHTSNDVAMQDAMTKPESDAVDIKTGGDKASGTTQTTRSADVHTHGDAALAIVLEKNMVTIELDSPVYNILGFEHTPETDLQKAALNKAELHLGRGDTVFTLNKQANCTSLSNDLTVSLFEKGIHDEKEGHHDDKETDGKEAHEHEAHTEDHDEDTHKDVIMTYEFKCQNPAKLSNVTINLFEFFKELTEVDVTFLGPATQKQVTLNRHQRQLDITP